MIQKLKDIWQLFNIRKTECNVDDSIEITTIRKFKIVENTTGIFNVPTFEAVDEDSKLAEVLFKNNETGELELMPSNMKGAYRQRKKNLKRKTKHIVKVTVQSSKVKDLYVRHAIFPIEKILPMLKCMNTVRSKTKYLEHDGFKIKTNSRKYRCFKKSINCCHCGIEGKFFAAEKSKVTMPEHYCFNLYGLDENGKEILMTCDHIVPKSKGGSNSIDNVQTLCWKCNVLKDNKMED
jgi:5-methylcytosine-specific restriction endonuclease McrA